MIKYSIDWQEESKQLYADAMPLQHNKDVIRLIKNIGSVVTELSKHEVIARQEKKLSTRKTRELVEIINLQIDDIRSYLLMALLCNGK